MNKSEVIFQSKTSLLTRLLGQFGEIVILEAVFLYVLTLVKLNFLAFQFVLILIYAIILFSKYNKPVLKVRINYEMKQMLITYVNFFSLKEIVIPFKEITISLKLKLLLNNIAKVIEIRKNERIIFVIPFRNYLWRKEEIGRLLNELKSLALSDLKDDQFINQLGA
jgi:hypothetical protein